MPGGLLISLPPHAPGVDRLRHRGPSFAENSCVLYAVAKAQDGTGPEERKKRHE
nr:MAG TPA: hypothetical protein [Caudoviricetes sp.]